ncbi:Annexin A11, partial [Termitomyces sp. T112]
LSVEYKYKYGSDLSVKIRDDLSGQTEKLYLIALNARRPTESTPIDYTLVDKDILDLFNAGQGKRGRNEMVFFNIICQRSRAHLSAVVGGFGAKYRSLTKVIKSEFTGHMRASLLFAVEGVKPKRDQRGIWRDAKMIDKAMVGFGTRDKQLVYRIVRAQWDRERFVAIKEAYHRRTGKTLESRVKSETSGDYQKLMLALIKGD